MNKLRRVINAPFYGLVLIEKMFHCDLKKHIKSAARVQKILATLRDFNVVGDLFEALLADKSDKHYAVRMWGNCGTARGTCRLSEWEICQRAKFKKSEPAHEDFLIITP